MLTSGRIIEAIETAKGVRTISNRILTTSSPQHKCNNAAEYHSQSNDHSYNYCGNELQDNQTFIIIFFSFRKCDSDLHIMGETSGSVSGIGTVSTAFQKDGFHLPSLVLHLIFRIWQNKLYNSIESNGLIVWPALNSGPLAMNTACIFSSALSYPCTPYFVVGVTLMCKYKNLIGDQLSQSIIINVKGLHVILNNFLYQSASSYMSWNAQPMSATAKIGPIRCVLLACQRGKMVSLLYTLKWPFSTAARCSIMNISASLPTRQNTRSINWN